MTRMLESPRLLALVQRHRGTPMLRDLASTAAGVHDTDQALLCDLCAGLITKEHRHLVDTQARELRCICRACAVLFDHPAAGGRHYRLVPDRVRRLEDFDFPTVLWQAFAVPVDLAFFFRSSAADGVVAFYPGPKGATGSPLRLTHRAELERANPILEEMEPDIEALLVNRVKGAESCWLVPIDVCYRLVALMRTRWKGFAGGPEVWADLASFFDRLAARANSAARG